MNEWIKSTDKLPAPHVSVFGYAPELPYVGDVCYNDLVGQWYVLSLRCYVNVTHWMEMPKPPKNTAEPNRTNGESE